LLRDEWIRKLSGWTAEQLIFVDESTANERTAHRKYGWASIGITPRGRPTTMFKRSERWSILPVYAVDRFIVWEVVHRSFNVELFQEFIENKVLPRCNPYPGPRSIIVMDNALIHSQEVSIHTFHKTISSKQYAFTSKV
jgi:hypothetical protein